MLVMAGDIGGTKSLLAAARSDRDQIEIVSERQFTSPAYPDLAPIIREFIAGLPESIGAACFGAPGAVVGGECRTPNLPWFLTESALQRDTGIPHVLLVNDFAAAALGVLALPRQSLFELQAGIPVEHGTKAVIGAGTGLGQAILFWDGHDYRVNPTEAGHGGFAAQGQLQHALALSLEPRHLPVSVERIVSGPGLVRIYEFLVARGVPTAPEVTDTRDEGDPAARITRRAAAGGDPAAEQALDLFVDAYGAEAGSLALRVLATGGVYVAGGIAPKILPKLQDGTFMRAFARKGRMSEFMARFPVHVVLEPRVGLLGALTQAARLLA